MDNYKTVIPPSFPVDSKIINKLKKEAFDLDEKIFFPNYYGQK